jgi:hypothetical protein
LKFSVSFQNALQHGLFSEYAGKKLCISCQRELLESKGIEYRGLIGQRRGEARIKELANQVAQEKPNSKKNFKLCEKCHYYRSDSDSQIIDLGLFMPNPKLITFTAHYCAKFGFSLENGEEAKKCTSYITKDEYKEKALRGEINPNTDYNFRICPYCQTKFDLNKLSACPKCGAP